MRIYTVLIGLHVEVHVYQVLHASFTFPKFGGRILCHWKLYNFFCKRGKSMAI